MTTTPRVSPRRDDAVLRDLREPKGRPLLLSGGTVITGSPLMGDWQEADVLIGGSVIVGIGPGLLTAAGDDNMIVIDCAGTLVLPAAADFTAPGTGGTLAPGQGADIAVLRLADEPGIPSGALPARGTHLDILVTGGQVRLWNGRPLNGADTTTASAPDEAPAPTPDHPYVGLWVDENGFVRQELLPDGRYDEARGDRPSAYQGRYWISGARIDYLDDLGFWAFGEFQDDTLPPRHLRPAAHTTARPARAIPGVPVPHPTAPASPPQAARAADPGPAGAPPAWAPTVSTVALLTVLGVLVVGQMYTVLALLHPMATSLGAMPEGVTWTATAFGFAYAAGFLVIGPLTDRYGPRPVMTAGLLAATTATAAVAAAPDLPWAIALRIVQGLTAAAFAPAARAGGRPADRARPAAPRRSWARGCGSRAGRCHRHGRFLARRPHGAARP